MSNVPAHGYICGGYQISTLLFVGSSIAAVMHVLTQVLFCLCQILFLVYLIFALKCLMNSTLKEVEKNTQKLLQVLPAHVTSVVNGAELLITAAEIPALGKSLFLTKFAAFFNPVPLVPSKI